MHPIREDLGESGKSFNSPHKDVIREKWNKPIIKFLTRRLNDKLIYMGLPASNAEDINQWLEFIKIVIAFQCRSYGKESDESQSREDIDRLTDVLQRLERERKIENYVVYDGYLEEVVLRGFDNSPTRISFEQSEFITLYNLDFCNKISSPIVYTDSDGNPRTAYKFHAIQELLKRQKALDQVNNRFIFFLTVHCSYNGEELVNFTSNPPNASIKAHLEKYKALNGVEKHVRVLRLFICYHIQQYFSAFYFTPIILPVILYHGLNETPLVHFVILGISPVLNISGVPTFQTLEEITNQKLITIKEGDFINMQTDLDEVDVAELNPINFFVQSKTYNKLWSGIKST